MWSHEMWPGNHSLSSLSKHPMDVSTLTGCLWPDEEGYGQHLSLIKTHRTKFHGKAEHRRPGPERARGKSGMKSMVLMSCVIPDNTTRLGSPHLKTRRAISTLHDVRGESWVLVSCRMSTWVGSPFFITPWVLSLHFLALTPYLLTPSDHQKRGDQLSPNPWDWLIPEKMQLKKLRSTLRGKFRTVLQFHLL